MATARFPQPVHEFSPRVPWVIIAAAVLIPLLATLAVIWVGYPK